MEIVAIAGAFFLGLLTGLLCGRRPQPKAEPKKAHPCEKNENLKLERQWDALFAYEGARKNAKKEDEQDEWSNYTTEHLRRV